MERGKLGHPPQAGVATNLVSLVPTLKNFRLGKRLDYFGMFYSRFIHVCIYMYLPSKWPSLDIYKASKPTKYLSS